MVYVRAFLTVYLNRDEMGIHHICHLGVLETFPFHDMTPVTCGISYADQQEFPGFLGVLQGGVVPALPLNRVIGMLKQVGAAFVYQGVGLRGFQSVFGLKKAPLKGAGSIHFDMNYSTWFPKRCQFGPHNPGTTMNF
jgi:hypothetical protein